jgi:hypothetical protein
MLLALAHINITNIIINSNCFFASSDSVDFQIIGDNVDVYQKPRYMTKEHRSKSYHWFQMYAVKNRVNPPGMYVILLSLEVLLNYCQMQMCLLSQDCLTINQWVN